MINPLPQPHDPPSRIKSMVSYEKLLQELSSKNLTEQVIANINQELDSLAPLLDDWSAYSKEVRKSLQRMVKMLEKKTGLVTKNHHQNQWMTLGMATFGLPMGVVFSTFFGNPAYIALGIPIGMAIGIGVGKSKDNQAQKDGKVIDIVLEF